MSVLDELPQNASVVVIRLRSLGDAVLTTPALRLLKTARPDLRVSVVLDEVFAPLLEGSSDIDEVIRADRKRRTQAIREIRKRSPALCLNLHGGTSSAWMTALSGAKHRAGFAHFRMNFSEPKGRPFSASRRRHSSFCGASPWATHGAKR